jgi:hypothetical protein
MKLDESWIAIILSSMQLLATAMTLVSYTPAAGPFHDVISGHAGEDGVGREQGFLANRKSSLRAVVPIGFTSLKVEQAGTPNVQLTG